MMKVKNAVILAAGKSFSFAPFSYETPKALFKIKGETLVERLIRQLREAGVEEIAVVVGCTPHFFSWKRNGVCIS
jgi:CTP:phosphocholine cytidylyltransferase-like protein